MRPVKKGRPDPILALGLALALAGAGALLRPRGGREQAVESLVAGRARYAFDLTRGVVRVADARGGEPIPIEMTVVVDGAIRPLVGATSGTRTRRVVEVVSGGVTVKVMVRIDHGVLRARVLEPERLAPHRVELRYELTATSPVWVPGGGELAAGAPLPMTAAILDHGPHPLVIAAPRGGRAALVPLIQKQEANLDAGEALRDGRDGGDGGDDEAPPPLELPEEPTSTGRLVVTTESVEPPPATGTTGAEPAAAPLDAGRAGADDAGAEAGPASAGLDAGAVNGADAGEADDEIDEVEGDPDGGPEVDAAPAPRDAGDAGDARAPIRPELVVFLGRSPEGLYGQLFKLLGLPTARVSGRVTGATGRPLLYGVDDTGRSQVRALVDKDGRFSVEVPRSVDQWFAIDGTATSAPLRYPPGTEWPLVLDLSPGGELAVRVTDPDARGALPARVWVHGIDGTLDPSFGPHFRASGAGPLVDTLTGELVTPLPKGRYRVEATHGLEWTVDARVVEVRSGKRERLELSLRHVVATPHLVACDLHVHARPSFDSLVSVEDRVTTLVTAGIEFAVPTEHNIAGDYEPAIAALGVGQRFSSVTGVEVTTFGPRYGHFGVFPYPTDIPVPPYRQARAGQMFAAARKGDPSRIVQVNHPRLGKGIGYFNIVMYDAKSGIVPAKMRTDFDTIEVYNGYEIQKSAQVEAVLKDWLSLLAHGHRYAATGSSDSHTVQYNWAGYPRTYAYLDEASAGEPGHPVDGKAVVAALKAGRSLVTSGPIVELSVAGARPGEETSTHDSSAVAHVRVLAAPWLDVTSVELYVDGKSAVTRAIPSRPSKVGAEEGTLAEAQVRAVRFEGDLPVALGPGRHFLVAVARGKRTADDVLPFMPYAPMGFTNPVWVTVGP